jgi:rubredoxin
METQHLVCVGCGNTFDFTEGEQKFFQDKGFSAPRRCPVCRANKRAERERAEQQLERGEYHGAAHFG